MKDEAKECFQVGKGCFQVAWHCTQFWTTLSISAIVIWLVYRPYYFHPNVDSAVLNTLNLTTNSTGLQYDLAVDMSFHNSGTSTSGPPPSMVEPSSAPPTTPSRHPSAKDQKTQPYVLHPTFQGTVAAVDSSVAAELERELAAGTVHIRVSASLTIKYKVGLIKQISFYKYDCWLWFRPPQVNAPAIFDAGTRCWLAK
ncbi:unnamed protein product [Urochloa decumbens]|uniref:Late embryogenesis abundant protein LEA-2 subgroup domain-containing protein n=1 Tax=Urochloa decumbens TaxID=240449 RepID=A0ABC9AZM1_9POAL